MHVSNDPQQIVAKSSMSRVQIIAVAVCVFLNALDGFDILAISFAAPGIASEWSISAAALGVVLAMELVGMSIGSITLGGLADRYGRRPTIQICLILMTVGMAASALAQNVPQLIITRVLTGIGIGGMLAATNAMTAEFANDKYRNLCITLMTAGFPAGAILGGMISTQLLVAFDWRAIFFFGAACSAVAMVLVFFLLPESVSYLSSKQPKSALERINSTLKRMGHATVEMLPALSGEKVKVSLIQLFSPQLRVITSLLMAAYFMQIMTFYYILKWIPKIVVDMGYEPSTAGSVLVWANVGGAIGAILLGLVATRIPLRKALMTVMVMAFGMVTVFGMGQESISTMALISALTGFCTNAGVVGLFALMARSFPAEVRAGGTGLVIGVGRGGAALSPIVAGLLFASGGSLFMVSVLMGAGALVAALMVFLLGPALAKAGQTNV